jgi:hypothetical protein
MTIGTIQNASEVDTSPLETLTGREPTKLVSKEEFERLA